MPFCSEWLAKMQRMRWEISTSISWSIHTQPRNIFLPICNNTIFKKQKPYFCNVKTPFLHAKNHTFVLRICNIQITNTLRTPYECVSNRLRMRGEYIYAGTINRPLQLLVVCQNAANNMLITQHSLTKHPTNTPWNVHIHPRNAHKTIRKIYTFNHETPTNHSVRRRGRFIVPVSLYYQIYIFVSPNTYLTIIEYTYSFHQICISVPSYTCFHIIKYAFPFPISWVFTYMRAR